MTLVEDILNTNLKLYGNPRYLSGDGRYWILYKLGYFSARKNGQIYEHVYVYQEYYKLCMLPWGDVHHLDGISNTEDANRIENLQGMMHGQHMRITHTKDKSGRFCKICNGRAYTDKKGHERWYGSDKDGWKCDKCHKKIEWREKKRQTHETFINNY